MSTRERILSIRLLDKVSKHPLYARALGIEGVWAKVSPENSACFKAARSSRKP